MRKKSFAPRGWRNNNPLNIRRNKSMWEGEVKYIERVQNSKTLNTTYREYDSVFCQFESRAFGWRAAFKILKKYIEVYKLDTIRKIITRWAPACENQTERYIEHVSCMADIDDDAKIWFGDSETMYAIASAMCVVENGAQYNPMATSAEREMLYEGYKMALGGDAHAS